MNPMLIELTAQELADAGKFSQHAEMGELRLVQADVLYDGRLPLGEESLAVTVRYAEQGAVRSERKVEAATFFECAITPHVEQAQVASVRISCRLVATYELEDQYEPTDTEVLSFHKANAIFNTWPFFREFAHSTAARIGLPPPPIPFLRVRILQAENLPMAETESGKIDADALAEPKKIRKSRKK